MIGCIGPDFGKRFLHDMSNYGIDVRLDSTDGETGGFHLIYDSRGDRTLDVLGVAERIAPSHIPDEYLDAKALRRNALFHQLLQALIELAPAGSEERSLLESISNHVAARGMSPERRQLDLIGVPDTGGLS